MYRCREACRGGMVACATCILVCHWEEPLHRLQVSFYYSNMDCIN
jgi:hypothetical protein